MVGPMSRAGHGPLLHLGKVRHRAAAAGAQRAAAGAGAGAALGQFGVTAAYRYAEPRSIAVYDYTNVVFTALFGFVFFSQVPDALSVVGFLIILLAACAI